SAAPRLQFKQQLRRTAGQGFRTVRGKNAGRPQESVHESPSCGKPFNYNEPSRRISARCIPVPTLRKSRQPCSTITLLREYEHCFRWWNSLLKQGERFEGAPFKLYLDGKVRKPYADTDPPLLALDDSHTHGFQFLWARSR